MPKRRVTTTKRQREQAKRDRQQRKAERRANRSNNPGGDGDVMPTESVTEEGESLGDDAR